MYSIVKSNTIKDIFENQNLFFQMDHLLYVIKKGKYCLTHWASGICNKINKLDKIKECF